MTEEIDSLRLADLIANRRTIHKYKPDLVAQEKLTAAIDLAKWAPNHYLTQPWHFCLLGKETTNAMIDLNSQLIRETQGEDAAKAKQRRWREVPKWFVVSCVKSEDSSRQQEDYAACCCAIQNLSLVLWNQGIGIKWSTAALIQDQRFYDLLWIDPTLQQIIGLFSYGYPAEVPKGNRKRVLSMITELP